MPARPASILGSRLYSLFPGFRGRGGRAIHKNKPVITRALDTMGAITKGQRQTGGQGLFRADDNLEEVDEADYAHGAGGCAGIDV